ncbi:MAG: HAD-IIIA family hydrolase [Acidobacteria bacterium]|nr:HAD-IIIA family hydrolase [Acidobacteriota bacterium]
MIKSPERRAMKERPIKLYIFDADGTLRGCTVPGQPCPNRPGEWELLPGVKKRLAQIEWDERDGPHFAVATNQGGVGAGYFEAEDAYQLAVEMVEEAFGQPPPAGSIEVCTHAVGAGCGCRKPEAGMLVRLMRRFNARRDETLFVGDMKTDAEAARRARCRFAWAKDFFAPEAGRREVSDDAAPGGGDSGGDAPAAGGQR